MRFPSFTSTRYSWLQEKNGNERASNDDYIEDSEEEASGYVRKTQRQPSQMVLALSFILNLGLLVTIVMLLLPSWLRSSSTIKLLPTPVPDFEMEVKTFQLNPLFLSLPSNESNAAWESLPGPNGRGFINIDPNLELDLPDTRAGLSVFHQLHCLGALRKLMWRLMHDEIDREALLKTWPKDVTSPTYEEATQGMWHYAHCFDYLRQAIQCSADTSLEFVSQNTGAAVVDGLVYPHVCKNWESLWAYAKEYM